MIWTLIIILLAATLALGWRECFGLSRSKRAVLLSLRLGAIIVLGLVLLDMFPRLPWGHQKRSLLILTDASQSMTLSDGQSQNRWQRALARIPSIKLPDISITAYRTTGEGLKEGLPDSLINPLDFTDLSEALTLALREKPGAILLLSDGGHNRGGDPVKAAAAGIPVYVIGFGPTGGLKNALITDIWSDGQIEAGQPAEISLKLSGTLNGGRAGILENNVKLAEKSLHLNGDTVLTFKIVPKSEGLHRYTAVLENSGNQRLDQAAAVVSVVKKQFRLLFICPAPDWNLRFWRQAISRDPSYATDILMRQGTVWRTDGPRGQLFSGSFDSLGKYDAFAMGSCKPGDLPEALERGMVELIRQKGRGLFLLGSVRQGGMIGQLAPISYSREIKPAAGTVWPAPELFSTGMLQASKGPNFKRLPPLTLAKNFAIRDNNVLLLAGLQTSDQSNHPLWARTSEGAGRIIQISSEDLWHWRLAAAGAGRDTTLFGEMVQSSLKWVLGREGSGIEAGPERILNAQGQNIKFTGRWEYYSLQSGKNTRWSVFIEDGRGFKKTYQLADWGSGNFLAELGALPSGQYSYTSSLELGGKQIHSVRGKLYVEPGRDELRDHLQNQGLLRALASASGGQYWDEKGISEINNWSKKINFPVSPSTSGHEQSGMVLAVGLLLAGEWFLRRKWGGI